MLHRDKLTRFGVGVGSSGHRNRDLSRVNRSRCHKIRPKHSGGRPRKKQDVIPAKSEPAEPHGSQEARRT
jgi:hypothetical protein